MSHTRPLHSLMLCLTLGLGLLIFGCNTDDGLTDPSTGSNNEDMACQQGCSDAASTTAPKDMALAPQDMSNIQEPDISPATDASSTPDASDTGARDMVTTDQNTSGCVPEDNLIFCQRNSIQCGTVRRADNCGDMRQVACGECPNIQSCQSNQCICPTPKCEEQSCGTVTNECGNSIQCGGCDTPPSGTPACWESSCVQSVCNWQVRAGETCGPRSCSNNIIRGIKTCDAAGECVEDGRQTNCGKYRCNPLSLQCYTNCSTTSQCALGETCITRFRICN